MRKVRGFLVNNSLIIILLVLAVITVGGAYYFGTDPEWTKNTYPDYYNRGVSDFLKKDYSEAANQFTHVSVNSKDQKLRSLALYNLGTMVGEVVFDKRVPAGIRFQNAQYAIETLKEAISADPDNDEAKYNLELLRKNLPELWMQTVQEQEQSENLPGPGYSPGEEATGY